MLNPARRSATAKLFSRIRPTSSNAKSGARLVIMPSAVATVPAVRTMIPMPSSTSFKSRAISGSSSTISTSLGQVAKPLGKTHCMAAVPAIRMTGTTACRRPIASTSAGSQERTEPQLRLVVCALVNRPSRQTRTMVPVGNGSSMNWSRTKLSESSERPYNNLLRRLSVSDYALIAPNLASDEATAGALLYNPGDDVDVVHFPCGPSLVSYLVANEDGRDV